MPNRVQNLNKNDNKVFINNGLPSNCNSINTVMILNVIDIANRLVSILRNNI